MSVRTVSNVANDYAHVAPATRRRVQQAIDELGYRPNVAARQLRRGRTETISLVVPEIDSPYFAELASLTVRIAEERGWTVHIDQTDGDAGPGAADDRGPGRPLGGRGDLQPVGGRARTSCPGWPPGPWCCWASEPPAAGSTTSRSTTCAASRTATAAPGRRWAGAASPRSAPSRTCTTTPPGCGSRATGAALAEAGLPASTSWWSR